LIRLGQKSKSCIPQNIQSPTAMIIYNGVTNKIIILRQDGIWDHPFLLHVTLELPISL